MLVEDDRSIAKPLVDGLARYGIQANHVATGAAALAAPPPTWSCSTRNCPASTPTATSAGPAARR
ncbi:hypothetical protein Asp14428_04860 [Actinoplanes sp. NBRC 14428]|nr:hypothetical protein Asp14428_04860 [Actinoplanes sp. NBRC 14428]